MKYSILTIGNIDSSPQKYGKVTFNETIRYCVFFSLGNIIIPLGYVKFAMCKKPNLVKNTKHK